jgi:hypothetical protein
MFVKYHQQKNGVGQLNEVSNIQMHHLARDVEKEEVIGNCNSDVKVRVVGRPVFKDGQFVGVGEE